MSPSSRDKAEPRTSVTAKSFNAPLTKFEKDVGTLCATIMSNPGELWDRRAKAMTELTELFQGLGDSTANDAAVWDSRLFKTLLNPIDDGIKDLRSQITEIVGELLVALAAAAKDAASPFLYSLLPSIFLTLNSGTKLMSSYMDAAFRRVLPHCKIKKGCAYILREVSVTKSPQLKEILVAYYGAQPSSTYHKHTRGGYGAHAFFLLQFLLRAPPPRRTFASNCTAPDCVFFSFPSLRLSYRHPLLTIPPKKGLWRKTGATCS